MRTNRYWTTVLVASFTILLQTVLVFGGAEVHHLRLNSLWERPSVVSLFAPDGSSHVVVQARAAAINTQIFLLATVFAFSLSAVSWLALGLACRLLADRGTPISCLQCAYPLPESFTLCPECGANQEQFRQHQLRKWFRWTGPCLSLALANISVLAALRLVPVDVFTLRAAGSVHTEQLVSPNEQVAIASRVEQVLRRPIWSDSADESKARWVGVVSVALVRQGTWDWCIITGERDGEKWVWGSEAAGMAGGNSVGNSISTVLNTSALFPNDAGQRMESFLDERIRESSGKVAVDSRVSAFAAGLFGLGWFVVFAATMLAWRSCEGRLC